VFPAIGYCQGMNYIISFILMVAGGDSEEAWKGVFSLFTSSNWMLYALFLSGFPLLKMIAKLTHDEILNKNPQLYYKIQQLEIDDNLLFNKWILTLYLYSMPFSISLQLWDAIIAKGIWVMVEINVLLINSMSNEIIVRYN
jgi:hypothetical protein